jgi:hypothetical protein
VRFKTVMKLKAPLRRLQEFAGEVRRGIGAACPRATKEANLAGCLSECDSRL